MQRESTLPEPPTGIPARDRNNFIRHFRDWQTVELREFSHASAVRLSEAGPMLRIDPDDLDTPEVARFAAEAKADACVIFGPGLIKSPVFEALPEYKINLHLGLSPRYRGSATLFWPFYNLEPQRAGAALHIISPEAHARPILHTCVPELRRGDSIHDVGARTVLTAGRDMVRLLERLSRDGTLKTKVQPKAPRRTVAPASAGAVVTSDGSTTSAFPGNRVSARSSRV